MRFSVRSRLPGGQTWHKHTSLRLSCSFWCRDVSPEQLFSRLPQTTRRLTSSNVIGCVCSLIAANKDVVKTDGREFSDFRLAIKFVCLFSLIGWRYCLLSVRVRASGARPPASEIKQEISTPLFLPAVARAEPAVLSSPAATRTRQRAASVDKRFTCCR